MPQSQARFQPRVRRHPHARRMSNLPVLWIDRPDCGCWNGEIGNAIPMNEVTRDHLVLVIRGQIEDRTGGRLRQLVFRRWPEITSSGWVTLGGLLNREQPG
jgi:hypothetical protein